MVRESKLTLTSPNLESKVEAISVKYPLLPNSPCSFPSTFIIIGLYSPSPSTSAPSSVTRSPPSLKFVFGITIISSIVKVTVSKNSLLCFEFLNYETYILL